MRYGRRSSHYVMPTISLVVGRGGRERKREGWREEEGVKRLLR